MRITARKSCRLCGAESLRTIYDFGMTVLTGRFPRPSEGAVAKTPMDLVQCEACKLVQLRHSVDTGELYSHDYGYRSGVNATMRGHLAALVKDIERRVDIGDGDVVVDIAANDGTLLSAYSSDATVRVGIDPIINKFADRYRAQDRIAEAYFDAATYRSLAGDRQAKVITSISVFYDIEDPVGFASDIRSIIDPVDGLWVLEQSYMPTMVALNSFDTVCQEHISYFGLAQIDDICRRAGLKLVDVSFNDINGGSFRAYVAHRSSPREANDGAIGSTLREEARLQGDSAYFPSFCRRIEGVRDALRSFLAREARHGRSIYIYGASTKGNMIAQYCGIDASQIVAAADRNPEKWGRLLPGTTIPIVSEADARAARPDYFLVLPWHFKDEFLERERPYLEAGGRFIFPLPEPVVVGADGKQVPLMDASPNLRGVA